MRKPDPRKALSKVRWAIRAWEDFNAELVSNETSLSIAAWKELDHIKAWLDDAEALLTLTERATHGTNKR